MNVRHYWEDLLSPCRNISMNRKPVALVGKVPSATSKIQTIAFNKWEGPENWRRAVLVNKWLCNKARTKSSKRRPPNSQPKTSAPFMISFGVNKFWQKLKNIAVRFKILNRDKIVNKKNQSQIPSRIQIPNCFSTTIMLPLLIRGFMLLNLIMKVRRSNHGLFSHIMSISLICMKECSGGKYCVGWSMPAGSLLGRGKGAFLHISSMKREIK